VDSRVGIEMASYLKKRFEKPDETTSPPKAKVDVVRVSDLALTRITYMPGWKWSNDMKTIAGTNSCQKHHIGYCLSGHMAGKLDNGDKWEFGPGDIADIPPGHDGWVVGNEPVVLLEFGCPAVSK
jgi:hypothetical protein